jgi:UDPglucose 6-dehydrogenase
VSELSKEIERQNQEKIVIIISTVLPGTISKEIKPLLNKNLKLCYNPFFIAMGTTIKDFTQPEFVLFGVEDEDAYNSAKDFYSTIHDKPVYKCTIEEAEMIKVTYNTYITMKICLANTVMEVSHKLNNINCDNVMKALSLSNERLMSPKYLFGGMGDGGGCHPRDQIAMSWLAKEAKLSFDIFEFIAHARDAQTLNQANIIKKYCREMNRKPVLLGISYKPNSPLDIGSPARLLEYYLTQMGYEPLIIDSWVYSENKNYPEQSVYFLSSRHEEFKDLSNVKNSLIIDPWGFVSKIDPTSDLITPGRT